MRRLVVVVAVVVALLMAACGADDTHSAPEDFCEYTWYPDQLREMAEEDGLTLQELRWRFEERCGKNHETTRAVAALEAGEDTDSTEVATPAELSGEITSGEILEGYISDVLTLNVTSITQNELEFTVDPAAGTVEGGGVLISEMTLNNPDDAECNGAPFTRTHELTFAGTLDDDGTVQGSLDVALTAKAADANCQDRFSDGLQTGTFDAEHDPQAQTLVGTFADERFIDSGFEAEGS